MVRPKRSEQHDLQTAIKDTAWKQAAENGAASLSLRAIARELGITAPAIYNYYPRRDDLVTALIVDAFTSLGDTLERDDRAVAQDQFAARLAAVGYAYRQWALDYPQRYNLIFGTPITGYAAPLEITRPAAARGLDILVGIIDQARIAGKVNLPDRDIPEPLGTQIAGWRQAVNGAADIRSYALALIMWTRVHGVVSLELYRQFPPPIGDADVLFKMEIETSCAIFR
jgi:AcrR family transcriptional regulator